MVTYAIVGTLIAAIFVLSRNNTANASSANGTNNVDGPDDDDDDDF
jgi:PTS system mannose-specific IIC component